MMRSLATIVLGISEIMLDRSMLQLRQSAEGFALRLGLVAVCVALGCAAAGFFLAALYDVASASWGPIPAKMVLGSMLAFIALAVGLVLVQARPRSRRLMRRV